MRHLSAKLKETYRSYRTLVKRAAALSVMIVVTVGSVVTVMAATHTAHIVYDGSEKNVEISDPATEAILLKAGYQTNASDEITRTDDPNETGDVFLTVRTGFPVTVDVDGTEKLVTAHYGDTVADVLDAADVTLAADDELTPSKHSPAEDGMTVTVTRRCSITISADGETVSAVVHQGTVYSALKEAGFSVSPDDLVSADDGGRVSNGMDVSITRVTKRETTETQTVAFKTEKVSDPTLASGTTKVQTEGKNGTETIVKEETLQDGAVSDSTVISDTVTEEPVDKIILVGTKKTSASSKSVSSSGGGTFVDQSGNTVTYQKCYTGTCTAYTGGGTTSTGKAAAFGLVAVNPDLIPYGTRLYICSPDGKTVYGYAVAADTGGGAKSGRILADLYYDTLSQCLNFGVKNMRIYIL